MEGLLLPLLRAQLERRVAADGRDREQVRKQQGGLAHVLGRQRQHGLELVELALGRVLPPQPRRPLEQADYRVERGVGVVGRAELAERGVRLAAQVLAQGAHQTGLADAGLAREQDHLALALPCPPPAVEQERELVLAANQRGEPGRVQGLEAALGGTLAQHGERAHRPGEALQAHRSEVAVGEQVAKQAARSFGDDDGAGLGQPLQPGRQVRGLADHGALARLLVPDQIADHHASSRDPDPGGERPAGRRGDAGHDRGDGEPGPDGAFGLVLVRLGPAEVGQHPVAHVLGDVALEAGDLARDDVLVGPYELAHLLGIEPGREGGRADQVDEHHRELPALRARDRRHGGRSGCRGWSVAAQLGDRVEQLEAGPKRQAELLEVLVGQPGQHRGVDLGVAERRRVALQPEITQPNPDVHPRPPDQERSPLRPQFIPSRAGPTRPAGRLPLRRRVSWPYPVRRRSPARRCGSPLTVAG